ncbi:hypothetical protein VP01_2371g4 [Puccinia sorghi]|uniref:J domain-containing protein n=1 Tax=Puccinia sorghi TaxID=27349 RepID=A0A0L6V7S5_9BASI|nr:hypothetical protein VP01_2371g4 [Puccinia sorghi]
MDQRHQTNQYYEILELKRESDESQIKSAYRKVPLFVSSHMKKTMSSSLSQPGKSTRKEKKAITYQRALP